ncbi:MAG: hypothetical protein GC158_00505 [Cyanobacteria bacterium RI_101]|nr:hypothetical protein [Cyanobacteria bacterium RI_101]
MKTEILSNLITLATTLETAPIETEPQGVVRVGQTLGTLEGAQLGSKRFSGQNPPPLALKPYSPRRWIDLCGKIT